MTVLNIYNNDENEQLDMDYELIDGIFDEEEDQDDNDLDLQTKSLSWYLSTEIKS